jgi:hypothetical protein
MHSSPDARWNLPTPLLISQSAKNRQAVNRRSRHNHDGPAARITTNGEESREEEWRNIEMSEPTPEELRAKRVRAYLTDLLDAARSAHEATAVLHHTSYSITELDSLKLHTNFIRAQAERITSMVNELVGKIDAGEITMEDFSLK